MKKFSMYRVSREAFPDRNPDWRAPYNHIAKWTDEDVAFEFLRRNLAYWRLVEQLYPLGNRHTGWPSGRLGSYSNLDIDQQAYDELVKRAEEEFGLWLCCDPRLPIAGQSICPWTPAVSISSRYQYAVRTADVEHDHMQYRFGRHTPPDAITIDLRADGPIEPQVEFVRWVLNRVRSSMSLNHRRVPRFQRALFAEYLRLLDARDDGASLRTIAGHVYRSRVGADDLVRKRLKAAEALRDGGYRDLLLWTGKIELPDFLQSIPDEFDELTELAESGDSEGFEQLMAKLVQKRNR